MSNIRKLIYDKYNDNSEKLIDILSELMRNKTIDVDILVDILKLDSNLLLIYKTECENLNLLKGRPKKLQQDLSMIF